MFHTIEFRVDGYAELEVPGTTRLQQVTIQKGSRFRVQVKPYVVLSGRRPVEVADLFLEDGSVARGVRFASFRFLDASEFAEE